jgi:hypothetical protein
VEPPAAGELENWAGYDAARSVHGIQRRLLISDLNHRERRLRCFRTHLTNT